jgi:hypothetical protein
VCTVGEGHEGGGGTGSAAVATAGQLVAVAGRCVGLILYDACHPHDSPPPQIPSFSGPRWVFFRISELKAHQRSSNLTSLFHKRGNYGSEKSVHSTKLEQLLRNR